MLRNVHLKSIWRFLEIYKKLLILYRYMYCEISAKRTWMRYFATLFKQGREQVCDWENLLAMKKHIWIQNRSCKSFKKPVFISFSILDYQTKAIQIQHNTFRWKFHQFCGPIVNSTDFVDTLQWFSKISWKSFGFH